MPVKYWKSCAVEMIQKDSNFSKIDLHFCLICPDFVFFLFGFRIICQSSDGRKVFNQRDFGLGNL